MADITNGFGAFDGVAEVATDATSDKKKAAQEQKKVSAAMAKAAYNSRVANDPDFAAKTGSEKDNLEVTKCLSWGKKGLVQKEKGSVENGVPRKIESGLPENVGYRVKNIGNKPYRYQDEEWALDEATGTYVPTSKEKTLAPGEEADMCKYVFFTFLTNTEFSHAVKNGTSVTRGISKDKTLREIFNSFYFKYNSDTGHTVHDDDVTELIGPKGSTTEIYPQFISEFGYLLNKKAGKKKGAGAKTEKASILAMVTAFAQEKQAEEKQL